jgi:ubiquinone/menaquinone biosynthesis C-methylase UbiE
MKPNSEKNKSIASLSLKVNELFHDMEGKAYREKHKDIFSGEVKRWQEASKIVFGHYASPFTVMDIGTGTGFVPHTIAGTLSENETFICTDISQKMLDVAKHTMASSGFKCRFEYLKLNGSELPKTNDKISLVTLNSVLHHIPDLESFFTQLDQMLEPGGRIMIGHEPNKAFYQSKFLFRLSRFLHLFSSFKELSLGIARFTRLSRLFSRRRSASDPLAAEINRVLLDEHMITKDLTRDEINKLVDYHSPTGGIKPDLSKGIDLQEILKDQLKGYRQEQFETYHFLGKMSERNALTKRLNHYLAKHFPHKGAHFFAVLIKEMHAD